MALLLLKNHSLLEYQQAFWQVIFFYSLVTYNLINYLADILPKNNDYDFIKDMELTEEIKTKVIETLNNIKEILANNLEFADELIKKSLLISQGVTNNYLNTLIWKEYPNLYEYEGDKINRGSL